jgi:phosphoribosylaminoimidazole-succinocarboxamide synthase
MSNDWVNTISKRYIELYEKVIGEPFVPVNFSDEETFTAIVQALTQLK